MTRLSPQNVNRASLTNEFPPKREDFETLAGNDGMLKQNAGIIQPLPIYKTVSEGQPLQIGTYLGNIGHSGNSTEPHLHFQLMGAETIESAMGDPLFSLATTFQRSDLRIAGKRVPLVTDSH